MISRSDRFLLRKIARDAIKYGLRHQAVMPLDLNSLPPSVTAEGASFVTLYFAGALHGCIGTLEAYRPLAEDVASNAYSAAFRDRRFDPVTETMLEELDVHISVLSKPESISCQSEQSLLNQLKAGEDGLILEDDHHRATFLPAVWDSLHSPEQFVAALKRKAGLPVDYWSDSIRCYRYHTENF
ncbi:AmmeMemoRadiSam system protein A [Methylophaga sp.]|jgi:AmmeMemoRadiSam system protein A|uniref:AmmeMemoRadiSam system protein A n=1 Tax=Methylophaga sp. TaxID=2024840 RepID=UPI0013FF83EE|nr:AmmeMemoRadiSam system protein A [Methylophaga sp.]MTI62448.1 AmmeMemoRadiSam system protein A [Methylophaga sp.]